MLRSPATATTAAAATAIAVLLPLFAPAGAAAQQLSVVGFNVESGGADPRALDDLVRDTGGVAIWGFSEVRDASWAEIFTDAAEAGTGASFDNVLGTTGGADRLLIVYNEDLLELLRHFELHEINALGRVRAPLVAHFRHRDSGLEFLFMVNHLYRSRPEQRHLQSQLLNDWAADQILPVIAVGDYNYDWDVDGGETEHDAGFDLLTQRGVFTWVRPASLLATQCNARFESILDFVFVTARAAAWQPTSEILQAQPDYCPDDDTTSDHRPVLARFELGSETANTRQLLLQRIAEIERDLGTLRELVEGLP